MRRLLPLLVLPMVLLAGCGDDGAETGAPAPTTSSTTEAAPPTGLCEQLGVALDPEGGEERQAAFGQLHEGLADAGEEVHEALYTLETELETPDDGEALALAMGVLNTELECGG